MISKRRDCHHVAWFVALYGALAGCVAFAEPNRPREKPNIVLLMADDLGWHDTGFQGNRRIRTPNLDRLAQSGLTFDRFYAASPVCSPTRGSCLTGRHPSRYGIPTANRGHLRQREITLAELLHAQGYVSGHFGKWHLGTLSPTFSGKGPQRDPEANYMTPSMAGFDEWFSTEYAVATWDPYLRKNAHGRFDPRALYWHNGKCITDGAQQGLTGCDSRMIMDRAIPFIEQSVASGRPFFTVIWFHAPHQPVVGGPPYLAQYAQYPENQRHYYAVITALDDQVGRLTRKLESLGVARQTMIWFCSDNGPEGNPGPKGRSQGSAGPLRGRKRSLYEGGIRVPAFVTWPAAIEPGRRTSVPAVTSDLFPTVADVLGIASPAKDDRPYDGISLRPLFEQRMERRPLPIGFQYRGDMAVIDNRFKLVHHTNLKRHRSDNGKVPVATWELYDVTDDRSESANVAAEHPEEVRRLRKILEEWRRSCQRSSERNG